MRVNILGIPIDRMTFEQAVARIDGLIQKGKPSQVATVNPEFIMGAQRNRAFREVLRKSDLNTADGTGVVLAAEFLGKRTTTWPILRTLQSLWQGIEVGLEMLFARSSFEILPERITGLDLFWALVKLAEDRGYSIFLLGAGEGVADRTAERIRMIHPRIKIAGTYAGGTFRDPEAVKRVAKAKPDILFVAYGAPGQDLFIARNLKKLHTKVAIGVGGVFDFIVGSAPLNASWATPQKIAPISWQERGLGWLHRLFSQPWRIGRILTAVITFPWHVFRDKVEHPEKRFIPIECVIFDFGGVMVRNGVDDVIDRWWQVIPWWRLPALAVFYFRYIRLLEIGVMRESSVWSKFVGWFGTKRDVRELRQKMLDGYTGYPEMWALVKRLKKKYRVAMLTNNVREWMPLFEEKFHLSKHFEPIVASCYEGLRKPDMEIFKKIVERLDLPPRACIFIDDHRRNSVQAHRLGMTGIHFVNPRQTIEALRKLGVK
jgi:N-acetylglucosaminyldiphosphoundecaprenol N-acetyl-beta-D-mannosaminyltransferase